MKQESLGALYGDKILAQMAMKKGIYVNEKLGVHFNYDPPAQSMVKKENGCEVLVNFHRVATPKAQLAIHKLLDNIDRPIVWWDIWRIFGSGISDVEMSMREGWNYVGHIELSIPRFKVESPADCAALCLKEEENCLAWEWDSLDNDCRISPWIIVGFKAKGKVSGVNVGKVTKLANECP